MIREYDETADLAGSYQAVIAELRRRHLAGDREWRLWMGQEHMADKPFADMTADELAEQWRYWDRIIARAPGWGASLAAADDFRSACEMHLRRLGAWPPVPAASVGEG